MFALMPLTHCTPAYSSHSCCSLNKTLDHSCTVASMDLTDTTDEADSLDLGFRVFGDSDDESSLAGPSGSPEALAAAEHLDSKEAGDIQSYKKHGRKRPRDNSGRLTIKTSSGRFRNRQLEVQLSDVQLAAEVAEAAGLHPHRLGDHEQGVLNDDLNDEVYFQIRNYILALWRSDVTQYLSEDAAAARIQPKHRQLALSAWRFLDREGYINWGVSAAITDRPLSEKQQTVIVIGSGLAGLSAARQLRNHGCKVVVLEGADRPGGRVHTHRLEAGGEAAVADLGGSIITGVHSNPLAVLARQLRIPLHDISGDVPLYLRDGSELGTKVDKQSSALFDSLLDRSAELRGQMPSATAISLQAALDGLWERVKAGLDTLPHSGEPSLEGTQQDSQQQHQHQQEQRQGKGWREESVEQDLNPSHGQAAAEAAATAAAAGVTQQQQPQRQQQGRPPTGKGGVQHAAGKGGGQQQQPGSVGGQHQAGAKNRQHSGSKGSQQQSGSKGSKGHAGAKGGQQQRKHQRLADKYTAQEGLDLLINWQMANLEFANAAQMRLLSMRHWDMDDQFEHQGAHVFLPGGNLRLLQGLARDIPILYKTPAKLIQYCTQGVRVHTDAGVFEADAAIVTVPLGVLKRPGQLRFQPPLPPRKQGAIQRLGFGCLNKVMMLFPHCFWGDKDMFGHVNADTSQRGLYYLFYAYHGIAGGAVLAALVAGDAAIAFEKLSQDQAVTDVMQLLRSIFTPQGVDVPEPLQAVTTRWASDPLTYGSYSSVAVGSGGPADYEAMSRPVGGRLFFAGEATSTRYPATMHGAFATGIREAANVMAVLSRESGSPTRPKVRRHVPDADAQEAVKGQQLNLVAEALEELFGDSDDIELQPDVHFAGLKGVYGPQGSDLEDKALVQITLGAQPNRPAEPLYLVLPRTHLQQLHDLQGDELRMKALLELGAQPVGRVLSTACTTLLDAIWRDRYGSSLFEADGTEGEGVLMQPLAPGSP